MYVCQSIMAKGLYMRGMWEVCEHSGQGVVNHYDVIKVGVIRGEHIDILIDGSIYSITWTMDQSWSLHAGVPVTGAPPLFICLLIGGC